MFVYCGAMMMMRDDDGKMRLGAHYICPTPWSKGIFAGPPNKGNIM